MFLKDSLVTFNITTQGNTHDLVNISLYIEGVLNETKTISGISNETVFTKNFGTIGSKEWYVESCSNISICSSIPEKSISIQEYIENNISYSTESYETKTEQFILNTTIYSGITTSSATFTYDGTPYSSTKTISGSDVLFTSDVTIPLVTTSGESKEFYWTLNLDSNLYNTTFTNQTVYSTLFDLCNATLVTPFLNFTFKDESTNGFINASVPLATFSYYLGDGSVTKTLTYTESTQNTQYLFCASPNLTLKINPYFQYEQSPNYPQRVYDPGVTSYTNTITNRVLYLLSSSKGQYVTFQVVNIADQPISSVISTVSRTIGGSDVTISSGQTDSAGAITFFLSADFIYDFLFTKTGLANFESSFAPTLTEYTITMTGASSTINNFFQGINYWILPSVQSLLNDTTYSFEFNATSDYWDLDSFGFALRLANGSIVTYQTSTFEGSPATFSYDVNNQSIIYMDYFWFTNNTYTNATRFWVVESTAYTSWSISNFFTDLSAYLDEGFFGIDDFGISIVVYIVLFFSIGIMSYKYGINSPILLSTMVFAIIFFFDVTVDLIPTISGVPNLPTYLSGLVLIALIIKEGISR